MNPNEELDLTALALGELPPGESERVRLLIASSPELRAEYAGIQQTLTALRCHSSVPKLSLHPKQRDTVLAMGQRPSAPRPRLVSLPTPKVRKPNPFATFAKLAAAACLTAGAFVLGQKSATVSSGATASNDHVSTPAKSEAIAKASLVQETSSAIAMAVQTPVKAEGDARHDAAPVAAIAPSQPVAAVLVAKSEETPSKSGVVISTPPRAAVAVSAATPVAPAPNAPPVFAATPASLAAFNNASTQQETSLTFHPKLVKTFKQVFADKEITFASPLPESLLKSSPSTSDTKQHKPAEQPPLVIHSWKTDIFSCPWDSSRRLLRIIAQIPVDQPAVESNDSDYKFITKFDTFQVQGYRLVAEKHVPPSNGGTLAKRFAWYEIIPGRNYSASLDKPITLGTVDIAHHKRTAGGDATLVKLVDHGQKWPEAHEDYVFETAMVGFSLLLQGTPNVGGLDHRLVLDIAERAKGDDSQGERAKFIRTVQQAQRVAGL